MKYIKRYESNMVYKEGDYILLKDEDDKWTINLKAKILEVFKDYNYQIKSFYNNNDNEVILWIRPSEIERMLTSEEIEEFRTKENSIKYNI